MRARRLTDRAIEAAKATGKQREVFDAVVPGFALRVGETGRRSFVLFYRLNGKQTRGHPLLDGMRWSSWRRLRRLP